MGEEKVVRYNDIRMYSFEIEEGERKCNVIKRGKKKKTDSLKYPKLLKIKIKNPRRERKGKQIKRRNVRKKKKGKVKTEEK